LSRSFLLLAFCSVCWCIMPDCNVTCVWGVLLVLEHNLWFVFQTIMSVACVTMKSLKRFWRAVRTLSKFQPCRVEILSSRHKFYRHRIPPRCLACHPLLFCQSSVSWFSSRCCCWPIGGSVERSGKCHVSLSLNWIMLESFTVVGLVTLRVYRVAQKTSGISFIATLHILSGEWIRFVSRLVLRFLLLACKFHWCR